MEISMNENIAATFVLFLSNSAALKGIAKWDHFYSSGFRNLEEEREGGRDRGLRKEGIERGTYDRLSHV